jgi:hypothetical protein
MIREKEQFLINLAYEYFNQGDDYYATKTKKGSWSFGYSNDKPMQHGSGENFHLPDKMVDVLMKQKKDE